MRVSALLLLASALPATPQPYSTSTDTDPYSTGYSSGEIGYRHIDSLPRAEYPRPLNQSSTWYYPTEPEEAASMLALHTKNSFRPGRGALERLCVVEATVTEETGRRGELILRDHADTELWREPVSWLGPDARYRAYWLPAWVGGPGSLELVVDGEPQAECSADLGQETPEAFFEVEARDPPNPLDNGLGLMPAWQTLCQPGGLIAVRLAVPRGVRGRMWAEGSLAPRKQDHEQRVVLAQQIALDGSGLSARHPVSLAGLPRGWHVLTLTARLNGRQIVQRRQEILICDGPEPDRFGARYTSLRYTAPVYVNYAETMPWETLWRGKKKWDVVVDFPDQPFKFVLWRGCSYVPCWAFENTWVSYEWLEAEPDFHGAVDCVEPIMDKECRYSSAQIVDSSPARVVLHWRYALTDYHCKIIKDEWADEYFYLYPDAIGTRHLLAWFTGYGWHENQEYLFLNRPGNHPWQAMNPQALSIFSTDGHSVHALWPAPRFSADDWPDYIVRANVRDAPAPFMALPGEGVYFKVWADPYAEKPCLFNAYYHWPVSHGMRTEWVDRDEWFLRPTHSNLVNVVGPAQEVHDDHSVWTWLIGISPPTTRLREVTACWLRPGRVEVVAGPASFDRYDPSQRAYVVDCAGRPPRLRLRLVPDGDGPVINPALVINGWSGEARVSAPTARRVEVGHEDDEARLVVWMEGRFEEPTALDVWRRP